MTERDLRDRITRDDITNDSMVGIESYLALPEAIQTPSTHEFHDLHIAVNHNAERFWGLNLKTSDGFMEHGDGLEPRLRVLKNILRVVDIDESIKKWTGTTATKMVAAAKRNQSLVVRDTLSDKASKPSLHKVHPGAPKTYLDAHRDPEIRHQATNTLRYIGDPVFEVIRSLEGWRFAFEADVPPVKIALGRTAFTSFIFSAGSENYMHALSNAASWISGVNQKTL